VTDTIAVPAVLAVSTGRKNTDRYRKVQRFVEAFFTSLSNSSSRRGIRNGVTSIWPRRSRVWTRWSVAEEMLQRIRQANGVNTQQGGGPPRSSRPSLQEKGVANVQPSADQREALFREFLQWQQQRQRVSRQR